MNSHKTGILALSTQRLFALRSELAAHLDDVEQVLLGSLAEQTRRCGKIACRCTAGEPHGPYTYFTPRRGGRGMKYIPAPLLPAIRAGVEHGQQAEAILAEISAINMELLARRAFR
jgi:hypothetical protein